MTPSTRSIALRTRSRCSVSRTSMMKSRGMKTTPVWAEVAAVAGSVKTREGRTHYRRGYYLVFNEKHGGDAYAVSAKDFKAMYKRAT